MTAVSKRCAVLAIMAALAAAQTAAAVRLDLVPTTSITDVAAGDVVAFDIILDFRDDPTLGGGFDVTFDESQLSLLSFTEDVILGDPQFGRPPDYVPGSGLLESWGVGDFNGIEFGLVGQVRFEVLPGATTSVVALGPTSGIAGPWQSAIIFICCQNPEYGQATVTAIPLPAALGLFAAALGTLTLRARRPRRD